MCHKFTLTKEFLESDMPLEISKTISNHTAMYGHNISEDVTSDLDKWLVEHGAVRGERVIITLVTYENTKSKI